MICRLTGRLESVGEWAVCISAGPLWYEVLVPVADLAALERLRGQEITLHTIHYYEGTPTGNTFTPRLIGFLNPGDRAFFAQFITVRGISNKRALRAMALPAHQLAAAVEQGDVGLLTSLPEIGKKTAAQIIAELRGKLAAHLLDTVPQQPAAQLNEAQQIALEILVQWGDRRADAHRWVSLAVEQDPSLSDPQDIVRAAYRVKQRPPV